MLGDGVKVDLKAGKMVYGVLQKVFQKDITLKV